MTVTWGDTLEFSLNGRRVKLRDPHPQMKLIEYLREVARLPGTKLSCGEGGCGACTVVLCHRPLEHLPFTESSGDADVVFRAVNACLFPVCALDGLEVITVEVIGSTIKGLHAVQKRLMENNGTQCGFCTPGWVMNMYELLRKHGKDSTLTKQEVEDHFDGNLCRCTGYRPIFEAFHSFASDHTTSNDSTQLAYEDNTPQCQESIIEEHLAGCEHMDEWLMVEADQIQESRRSICEGKCSRVDNCSRYLDLEELFPPKPSMAIASPHVVTSDVKPSDFIVHFKPRPLKFEDPETDFKWYRPLNWDQLRTIFEDNRLSDIGFVGGRTAYGVSKYYNGTAPYNRGDMSPVQVEVNYITELKSLDVYEDVGHAVIGAAVTINTLLAFLQSYESEEFDNSGFRELATLVQRVANNQVRNSGTWAGNLSLCREYPTFVSDLVVGLMGIGATLTLMNEKLEREEHVSIEAFLHRPLADFALVVSMNVPLFQAKQSPSMAGTSQQATRQQRLCCYKVAQRPQNSHSHVNCAIWISSRVDQSPSVCVDTRVVFGGVCKYPARFPQTEKFLKGSVVTEDSLREAMGHMERDLKQIGASEAFGSSSFRLSVMKNLLYKAFLAALGTPSDPTVASASSRLTRGVSSGTQSFKPSGSTKPVSLPIPKIGAKLQVSGEAQYVGDKELPPSALYGAILFSTSALGKLLSIDKDGSAKAIPGVIDIITAEDIPGANDISSGTKEEPLFVPIGGIARCIGAPVGLVLAETTEIAEQAVARCALEFGEVPADKLWPGQANEPILTIDMATKAGTLGMKTPISMGDEDVKQKLKKCSRQLSGNLLLGAQKHFYMEPQVSVASMQEGGVVLVETSSQFPQFTQQQLASVLNVQFKDLIVKVQRVGGGFGGKLTRGVINAAAAAVAAKKHRQTVRVLNDRSADFRLVGGRENMRGSYEVGFDKDGHIQALDLRLDVDCGYIISDSAGSAAMAVQWSDSAYRIPSFRCQAFLYLTNTQNCTSLRAPGVPQSLVLVEAALHHVAETLGLPMRWVQERNFYQRGDRTPFGQVLEEVRLHEVWDRLIVSSYIEKREEAIAIYNSNNKWKKRGIAITPTKYGMQLSGRKDGARIEVFAGDGSVILTHGGCEIGQGIHTKAAQVCAYELGIDMSLISVRPTSTDQTPNSEATGGSSTSESIAQAVIACCQEIKKLMKPVVDKNPGNTWTKHVQLANDAGIRLFAGAQPFSTLKEPDAFDYCVYAAACSEVEVDILTGEINILKSEIVYDCGISLNPAIDIGQIEGGFIMGIGLYLEEDVVYSVPDGALLTQGTWEYKIPCSKDIPEKFTVTLLENELNKRGVLNSKATGEPPYALATSVYFAVKRALIESRAERGMDAFFHLDIPASVARRQDAAQIQASDYAL